MQCYKLAANDVPTLAAHLGAYGEVIAPHRKGDVSFSYEPVRDAQDIVPDYNRTLLPLKKFFLPPVEKLLDFSLEKPGFTPAEIEVKPRVFFAIHSYEMQAILRLDHTMLSQNPEARYFKRRQQASFVGISFEPDEYHFSESVGIPVDAVEGFDLFLNKIDNYYQLAVLTDKGSELMKGFKDLEVCDVIETMPHKFYQRLRYHFNRIPMVFDESYDSRIWDEVSNRCVGCGTCNLTCPTCYCFDVEDTVDVTATRGTRDRRWDSCMLDSFAEVAGGENFRELRAQRTRHRVFRKFKYITDHEGVPWCVGCGRCSAFCVAGISLPKIVNDLIKEYEENRYARTSSRVTGLGGQR